MVQSPLEARTQRASHFPVLKYVVIHCSQVLTAWLQGVCQTEKAGGWRWCMNVRKSLQTSHTIVNNCTFYLEVCCLFKSLRLLCVVTVVVVVAWLEVNSLNSSNLLSVYPKAINPCWQQNLNWLCSWISNTLQHLASVFKFLLLHLKMKILVPEKPWRAESS